MKIDEIFRVYAMSNEQDEDNNYNILTATDIPNQIPSHMPIILITQLKTEQQKTGPN